MMESDDHRDDYELPRFGEDKGQTIFEEGNNLATSTSDQELN